MVSGNKPLGSIRCGIFRQAEELVFLKGVGWVGQSLSKACALPVTLSTWLNAHDHHSYSIVVLYETFVQKTGQMNFISGDTVPMCITIGIDVNKQNSNSVWSIFVNSFSQEKHSVYKAFKLSSERLLRFGFTLCNSLWFRWFSVFRVTELVGWILGACEEAKRRKTQSTSLCPFSPSCAPNAPQGRETPCNCNWDCAYANEFSVCVVILRISAANGNVSFDGVDVCRRVWAAILCRFCGHIRLTCHFSINRYQIHPPWSWACRSSESSVYKHKRRRSVEQ